MSRDDSVHKISLILFVTGRTPRSEMAIANLHRICDELLPDQCKWSVVDVLERPDLAEDLKILVTPTLVKDSPPPQRRIIGDLSNVDQVLLGLMTQSERNTTARAEK